MIYARDLAYEQINKGNNLIMLMPGKYKANSNKSEIKYFRKSENLHIYQIINGLPASAGGVRNPEILMHNVPNNNYKKFLEGKKIDIVHVHSLIGLPREFILEAKELKIKTIFTTHDYYGICPQIKLYKYNDRHCISYSQGMECIKCNQNSNENLDIKRRNISVTFIGILINKIYNIKFIKKCYNHYRLKAGRKDKYNSVLNSQNKTNVDNRQTKNNKKSNQYMKLREYYMDIINNFDTIIFNSKTTMNEYSKYFYLEKKDYFIIPVTHRNIKDNRGKKISIKTKHSNINFAFMGNLSKSKGFFDLLDTLEEIKTDYKSWVINIYGDDSMINVDNYDSEFYNFNGRYTHNNLSDIFAKADMLIIPSKWKETFGFIGLEALSYGVPVLASDNVGFSDLIISGENGIVYKDDKDNKHLYDSIVNLIINPTIIEKFKENIADKDFTNEISEHVDIIDKIYNGEH